MSLPDAGNGAAFTKVDLDALSDLDLQVDAAEMVPSGVYERAS